VYVRTHKNQDLTFVDKSVVLHEMKKIEVLLRGPSKELILVFQELVFSLEVADFKVNMISSQETKSVPASTTFRSESSGFDEKKLSKVKLSFPSFSEF